MNPMKESWNILKGEEEFRIDTNINDRDRQRFGVKGLNPDDVPTSVPRAIQQSRPVNVDRIKNYTDANRNIRGGGAFASLAGEGADAGEEGLRSGHKYDEQGITGSRGVRGERGDYYRPKVVDPDDDEEIPYLGANTREGSFYHRDGAKITNVGQRIQAVPRPSTGNVDDLSRQGGSQGAQAAQTSGFQSKPYGRFMNRQPKMGPGGMPQGMGAFDEVNPQFKPTLRGMGVKTGTPMAIHDAWSFMKDERECDDCGKSGSCKKCCDDCGKKKCSECMDKGSCGS